MGVRLARVGGLLSIAVSVVVAILLAAASHRGFNLANLGTLLAGGIGGLLAFAWPGRRLLVGLGCALVVAGMVPALLGGVGLLYLPSAVCLGISAAMRRSSGPAQRVVGP